MKDLCWFEHTDMFSNWIEIGLCAEKPTHRKDGGGEEADGDAQRERGG